MARVRQREHEGVAAPRAGQSPQTDLSRLLRAQRFCLGEGPAQVLSRLGANLLSFGGAVDPGAAPYIGEGRAPPGQPSISLSGEPGTLGPHSFGFLNNVEGVAPLAAPMAERPRRGGVALVVPRRDALPEVVPLLLRRRLGVSWLISVGDGDPADAIRFLVVDPATTGILVALGRGVRAATLHGALCGKQAVLLDLQTGAGPGREGLLCRAVARRAGALSVTELDEWLAHGALLDAAARPGAGRRSRAAIVVVGGGANFVAAEAGRVRLPAPIAVEADEPEAVSGALRQAAVGTDLVVICGDPEVTAELLAPRPTLRVDPAQPELLRALFQAVARRTPAPSDGKVVAVRPDRERVTGVLSDLPPPLYVSGQMVLDEPLSDHDAKRFLLAYGAKVSRQAPANTVTAVLRLAGKIGLPVVLLPPAAAGQPEDPELALSCHSLTELKRQATLLLQRAPHVMVREIFPDGPRVRLTLTQERGLGAVLRLSLREGSEAALVPLQKGEARELAEAACEGAGVDPRGLAELFGQIACCAAEQRMTLEVAVSLSADPAVVTAVATLRRPEGR